MMTEIEINEKIGDLNKQLINLSYVYEKVRAELTELDNDMMELYREKWSLERQLIKVTKCPTYHPREPRKIIKAEKEIDLRDLSPDEILRVLKKLKEARNV